MRISSLESGDWIPISIKGNRVHVEVVENDIEAQRLKLNFMNGALVFWEPYVGVQLSEGEVCRVSSYVDYAALHTQTKVTFPKKKKRTIGTTPPTAAKPKVNLASLSESQLEALLEGLLGKKKERGDGI